MWIYTVVSEQTVKETWVFKVPLTTASTVIRVHKNPFLLCLPESKARNSFINPAVQISPGMHPSASKLKARSSFYPTH